MTPQMLSLLAHSLQKAIDNGFYCGPNKQKSSDFMCHALTYAFDNGFITDRERQLSKRFLSRWVRWLSHLTQAHTTCMVNVAFQLSKREGRHTREFTDAWSNGDGTLFYQALIQRLEQKFQNTSR